MAVLDVLWKAVGWGWACRLRHLNVNVYVWVCACELSVWTNVRVTVGDGNLKWLKPLPDGMLLCLHWISRIYRTVQFCSELAAGGEPRYSRDIQNTSPENHFCSATQTHLVELGRLSLGSMGAEVWLWVSSLLCDKGCDWQVKLYSRVQFKTQVVAVLVWTPQPYNSLYKGKILLGGCFFFSIKFSINL